MNQKRSLLFICFILLSINYSVGQQNSNRICFNHSLLVLDSATYEAATQSEFIKTFAFAREKQFKSHHGFYLVGKSNYLELFHLNSIKDYPLVKGDVWICLASLKANYIKQLNPNNLDLFEYETDEQYHSLNLRINDSIKPITTWEMQKEQFESWTHKKYNDSIDFLPVDYISAEESDSSGNYFMKDVIGIGLSIHSNDSSVVHQYLNELGFNSSSNYNGHLRLTNGKQFFELHVSDEHQLFSINRYYIELNEYMKTHTEVIGNSRIECNGTMAIWIFE